MLLIHPRTTTAQEICDSIVTMGETLFSCYLYSEIIVRRHRPAFFVTSNTRCTQGYYKFDDFLPSHRSCTEVNNSDMDGIRTFYWEGWRLFLGGAGVMSLIHCRITSCTSRDVRYVIYVRQQYTGLQKQLRLFWSLLKNIILESVAVSFAPKLFLHFSFSKDITPLLHQRH